MKKEDIRIKYKGTRLISILVENLAGKMNLVHIKVFGLFICALYKVQTVCFEKLATAFETDAKSGSSLRRIQRFMASYAPDTDLIAQLIFKMLPHAPLPSGNGPDEPAVRQDKLMYLHWLSCIGECISGSGFNA